MTFSALIPIYNTSEYLEECFESLSRQSFVDYEAVLIDDGSSDISAAMCDAFASIDSSVIALHKPNEGLMMTRRRGFQIANGDFFVCIDSDDYLLDENAMEKIAKVIDTQQCDLVIYDYIHGEKINVDDRYINLFPSANGNILNKQEVYHRLLTSNQMNNMWLKCARRDIVDIDVDYSQWRASICRAEDIFQSYPILTNASKIGYVSEPLYYYRWAQNSISNNYKLEYYNAYYTIYQREAEYVLKWKLTNEYRDRAEINYLIATCKLVVFCYAPYKKKKKLDEWKTFIRRLSMDALFCSAESRCDIRKLSRFYRMIYYTIIHKWYGAASSIVAAVPRLYGLLKLRGKQ